MQNLLCNDSCSSILHALSSAALLPAWGFNYTIRRYDQEIINCIYNFKLHQYSCQNKLTPDIVANYADHCTVISLIQLYAQVRKYEV